jgi:hypothetical protein
MEPVEVVNDFADSVTVDVESVDIVVDDVPVDVESIGAVVAALPVVVELVDVVVDAFPVVVEPVVIVVDPVAVAALLLGVLFSLFRVKPTLNPIVSATTANPIVPIRTNRLRRVDLALTLATSYNGSAKDQCEKKRTFPRYTSSSCDQSKVK